MAGCEELRVRGFLTGPAGLVEGKVCENVPLSQATPTLSIILMTVRAGSRKHSFRLLISLIEKEGEAEMVVKG